MITKILYGREKSLTLPNGEKRTAQYVIVDLDELKASHNEISFADTIGYPTNEYGRNINDRNYKTDPAAQQTVISIAKNLDADKLIELTSSPSGTPIINKDGFVVSGNNRIMSLKLAAAKYPEQYANYKRVLTEELGSFGFSSLTPLGDGGFSHPVLVRIDKDIPTLNTTELAKYNLTARKGERPVDQAVKLGNILRENEKCRTVILSIVDGYETFSDLYAQQGRNDRKRLVQAFVDCGLIPEQQVVSYYNEYGDFTEGGKDFLENVLSAMVLSPDALNVAGQEGIRRLRQIIISSLPVLITNENLPEGSLRPYISEAVVIEYKARQVGDFADYMRSQQLFEGDAFNEKSYYINRLLNEGRNTFKEAIKKYTDAVKSNSGQSLFGSEQLSIEDIFDRTIVSKVQSEDGLLILQKFSKPKKMDDQPIPSAPVTITLYPKSENTWANDDWFKENPDKVLGTAYETSGRFGAVTKYKGTLDDLNKIEVPDNFIGNMKSVTDPLTSVDDQRVPELDALSANMQDKIGQILVTSEQEIDRKIVRRVKSKKKQDNITDETIAVKETADLQTFEDIYAKYNPQISKDELEVFIWWKSHTGKPLSQRWVNLITGAPFSPSGDGGSVHYNVPDEKIKHWVTQGLLYYYNGKYEPEVIYLSGNVYDKQAQLKRDKDEIIEKYGQAVYDNQMAAFAKAFRRKYESRLQITGQSANGLSLIPISKFAEKFTVTSIEMLAEGSKFKIRKHADGPDFIRDPETNDYKREQFDQLNLKYAFAYWLQRGTPELREAISVMDIIRFYLLGGRLINRETKGTVSYEAEKARIEKLKSSCQREGQRLFLFFLSDQLTTNDKVRLETEWNSLYNNHLPVDYNKIPVAFTMCKYYKGKEETLKPEKREAVAFSMVEGSACLSYDVGVGKTPSAIFTISAFMDAGYCKRPFICVPNQVYKQFISEIKSFAPHIPVMEAYNLSSDYVPNFQDASGNIVNVPAGTITVMTYEGLEQIGFTQDTSDQLFSELYEILNQGGEDERAKTQKQKESFQAKLETIIGKGLRGTLHNIEDFGFDFGCYDEAHKMKKVFTAVKGEVEENETGKKERGRNPYVINSGTPSAIGLKGFMLNYYIQKNNGWQNVLLLTATPFTNSPLEIFSMLSMIAYNKLRETDLNNIKSFFDTYVSTSTELVINSRLQPQFKQVILGFNNLLSMQTLIRRFINYKTGDQVNVQRPKKYVLPYLRKLEGDTVISLPEDERIETYIQMTPAQKAMMDDIVTYVEGKMSLSSLKMASVVQDQGDSDNEDADQTEGTVFDEEVLEGNTFSDKEKRGVKIIRGITFSRNLALSPYLYEYSGMKSPTYTQYVETSPKLKYVMECMRTVREYHMKHKEPVSGQVIYMDRGIHYFHLLKEYLVKEIGYAPHEIGIIRSGLPKNGKTSKEYVKNLFNGEIYNEDTKLFDQVPDEQRVKVIIGSSTIKEGINLQKYGTVLYNCFIDWNPTDIQQLEGRVWRQGNTFKSVRIVNPLVTDSADIFLFQKLQEKTSRLNSIWATDSRTNVLNTEEFDPQELKYALIRDPKVVAELHTIEEKARVDEKILGIQRLIENSKRVKAVIHTINYHIDDIVEAVQKYRDYTPTTNKLSNADQLVKMVIDIEKKQTDKQVRKIYDHRDAQELRKKDKWDDNKMVEASRRSWEDDAIKTFTKPYYFGDFALAVRDFKKMYTGFLLPNKIEVTLDNPTPLDKYAEKQEAVVKEMEEAKKKLDAPEYKARQMEEIIADRAAKKIVYKSLTRTVHDFTKLNYLLSDKKVDTPVRQLTVECPPMIGTDRLTDPESLKQLEDCVLKQTETKALHVAPGTNTYDPDRTALHKKIVDDMFANVKCVKGEEPIAIFTGGAPGSGKSTYLKTIPWLMNEKGEVNPNIFHIDADAIRAKLPEYSGWNSSATHAETRDIVNDVLNKVGHGSCKYDFIYDGTMNRTDKYFPLINKVKAMGYKTFILFMDVPYSVSKERCTERYKKNGRYVPMEVIDDFYTMLPAPINKTKGQYGLDQLKDQVDGYIVVNGVTGEITDSKGINLPQQRYYKKTQVQLVPAAEAKLAVSSPPLESLPRPVGGLGEAKNAKDTLKKQISALTVAGKYASGDDADKINKKINALKIALKYAA